MVAGLLMPTAFWDVQKLWIALLECQYVSILAVVSVSKVVSSRVNAHVLRAIEVSKRSRVCMWGISLQSSGPCHLVGCREFGRYPTSGNPTYSTSAPIPSIIVNPLRYIRLVDVILVWSRGKVVQGGPAHLAWLRHLDDWCNCRHHEGPRLRGWRQSVKLPR